MNFTETSVLVNNSELTEWTYTLQVISVNSPSEMYDYIEDSSVTTDVGGTLEFDATEWTQHRSVSSSPCVLEVP